MIQSLVNLRQPISIVLQLNGGASPKDPAFLVSSFIGEKVQEPGKGWEQWRILRPIRATYTSLPQGVTYDFAVSPFTLAAFPLVEIRSDAILAHQYVRD